MVPHGHAFRKLASYSDVTTSANGHRAIRYWTGVKAFAGTGGAVVRTPVARAPRLTPISVVDILR
jgi:hypothetical protein